ncbi:hypothetical protein Acr_29g0005780 [Actinidia rufa]|uniref:Uncharacterized protein n=1 Tax=Actinidia rufa TaxID=165716 RepID=A0A7J0HE91_9ERIC|nr:hypothetical protein Acr_29g0005780 [Actinidia rufa]
MSARSESSLIGADLKLWVSLSSVFLALCMQQLCRIQTFSMHFWPKRSDSRWVYGFVVVVVVAGLVLD